MDTACHIKDVLQQASLLLEQNGSYSSALDAEILLSRALGENRSYLRAWPEKPLSEKQHACFQSLLTQRKHGTPIAYILGEREFWSRPFYVTPAVLIPRPDTELLIDIALKTLHQHPAPQVIDLGTGSGIIAITLSIELPRATISACDLNDDALKIAKKNAHRHRASDVKFRISHWLDAFPNQCFDLIVSNPPYIDRQDHHLNEGDVRFEPASALSSAQRGLADITLIASQARAQLRPHGHLLLEHGFQQGGAVKTLLNSLGYCNIQQHNDLQGHLRATLAQYQPS